MLKLGAKAPDFRLKTDAGEELALRDLRGKRVVLFFFPKANTPG
ncbi:MAG: redoxin domain-containing protein [Candidatus Acidiferrum sp.]